MANGNVAPVRVLKGQATLLTRTSHVIAVDTVNDEIIAPNPFAESILFFRGGANGEEAPIRVIQGPKTLIAPGTDNVAVDPQHNEVYVFSGSDAILVFDRQAKGDVAPKRVIYGPKTRLKSARNIAVDPVNNVLAVSNRGDQNILFFNRTDEGDVAPKAILAGKKTGMTVHSVLLDPKTKNILVSSGLATKEKLMRGPAGSSPHDAGFVRVWKYGDNGEDVPPRILIKGLQTNGPMALVPETQDIWIQGTQRPDFLHVYHVPELFQ